MDRNQHFRFGGFAQLQHLFLKSSRIGSRQGFDTLANLETLALIDPAKEVETINPGVAWTGGGLEQLKGLKKLKELNIRFSASIDDGDKWWKPLLELTQIEDLALGLAQNLGTRDNIDFLGNLKDMARLRRLSIDAGSHEIYLVTYGQVSFPETLRELRFISGVVNLDGLHALRESRPELRISGTIKRIVHDRATFIHYGHRQR